MRGLLDLGGDGPAAVRLASSPAAAALIAKIEAVVGDAAAPVSARSEQSPVARPVSATEEQVWCVTFRPGLGALRNGMRPDLLMDELAGLGRVLESVVDTSSVPDLEEIDPMASYLGWTVRIVTSEPQSAIEAVFIFADDAEIKVKPVGGTATSATSDPAPDRDAPPASGEVAASATTGAASAAQMVAERRAPASRTVETVGETIRVPAGRLDEIVDQLGELVIAHTRLHGLADRIGEPDLDALSEEIGRLVSSLRDATLAIRMLPIETVFGKFRRVVRDLSAELGKEVSLVTEGGETEIDKNVIDRLTEPLVHMIRNSIDHGIESLERRRAAGKPDCGMVGLAASQEGGEVLIRIWDDGGGLDLAAIRAKAVTRGLIAEDAQFSDQDLQQLVFAPGFSTAQVVSKVSGRGVGMDAVKTAIDALRGRIEVDSRPGAGTAITLRLPVSLAIIDGLLVRLGQETFVIPLAAIEECVEMADVERRRESGRTLLQIREHLVPWLARDAAFSRTPNGTERRRLVIVRSEGQRLGLVVDDIIGQHQTVIKTFSAYHRGVRGLSGATILGDGSVALIVDVASLARDAIEGHRSRQSASAA